MNLERRILLASLLSLGILMLFSSLYRNPAPTAQPARAAASAVSPAHKSSPQSHNSSVLLTPQAENCGKEINIPLGKFNITICPTGGYIKTIRVKRYGDTLLFRNLLYIPQLRGKTFKVTHDRHKIAMVCNCQDGILTKEIILGSDNSIVFKVNNDINKVLNNILLVSCFKDKGFYARYEEFLFRNNDIVKRIPWSRIKTKQYSFLEAGGFRSRYYAFVLFDLHKLTLSGHHNVVDMVSEEEIKPHTLWIKKGFIGPQDFNSLAPVKLEWIINYGLFNPIAIVTLKALNFAHSILKNWGLSIIVLSILIYLILFPLSAAGFKSMQKMQVLQPKIEALRVKYKDDPQKLNRATLELYKKEGVNPLGGCLPMLLQIPVFFAFYQALIRSVEIKGASFLWIKDLSRPDYFIKLPHPLPLIGDGVHLLPIIMALIMFLQQRLTAAKGAGASEQQKTMAIILPVIFGFIFYNFPSGLVLYWLINNLLGFLYQYRISRRLV